jgi:GxxExxY protein
VTAILVGMNTETRGELLYKDETYKVIGICMEVHRNLGHGFLEIVYKDAIEFELLQKELLYSREQEFKIDYKGVILPHKFFADFVVENKLILEVKASEGGLADEQIAQTINFESVRLWNWITYEFRSNEDRIQTTDLLALTQEAAAYEYNATFCSATRSLSRYSS